MQWNKPITICAQSMDWDLLHILRGYTSFVKFVVTNLVKIINNRSAMKEGKTHDFTENKCWSAKSVSNILESSEKAPTSKGEG